MQTVSIIMPAFNADKTIAKSIKSVISQTYPRWELLIINDSSTDSTAQTIESFAEKDPRIRLYSNPTNLGAAESRNHAVSLATGEYIAFLDSDDLWHSDKLKNQTAFMQNENASISYTSTSYIYEGTHSTFVLHAKQKLTYRDLLKRNLMSCSSIMVKRELIQKYPFTKGNHHEDYATWLQILREVKTAHGLDEPLLIYRRQTGTKSGKLIPSGVMTYRSYRVVGYSIPVAVFLTFRYAIHGITKRIFVKRGVTKNDRRNMGKAETPTENSDKRQESK